jgi:hypothetical protein
MLFNESIGQEKLLLNSETLPHLLVTTMARCDSLFEYKLFFVDCHGTCCVAFVELAQCQLGHAFVGIPGAVTD